MSEDRPTERPVAQTNSSIDSVAGTDQGFILVQSKKTKKLRRKKLRMQLMEPVPEHLELNAELGERTFITNRWKKGKREKELCKQHQKREHARQRSNGRKKQLDGNSSPQTEKSGPVPVGPEQDMQLEGLDDQEVMRELQEKETKMKKAREEFIKAKKGLASLCRKLAVVSGQQDAQSRLTDAFLRAAGVLITASMATDQHNMLLVVAGAASQYISTSSLEDLLGEWKAQAASQIDTGPLQVQGSTEFLSKARSLLDKSASLSEVPMWRFITNVLLLTLYCGYKPHTAAVEGSTMRDVLQSAEKHILPSISTLSALDALLSLAEFMVELVENVCAGGSITAFLFPRSIMSRVAKIAAEHENLENGKMFEKEGRRGVYQHADSIQKAIKEIERSLEKPSALRGHVQTAYVTTLTQLRKYQEAVHAFLSREGYRMRPYFIALYGASGVGKSHAIPLIRKLYETAAGKKYDSAEVVDLPPDARFDDVVTAATKFASVDDLGNTRMENRDAADTFLGQLVRVVNNVPALTRQAEIAKKGTIWWGLDCLVTTSNLEDFGSSAASNYPVSLTNRARQYEMRPIKKYRNPDGSLNQQAVRRDTIDGVSPPTHEFLRYRLKEPQKPGLKGMIRIDDDGWIDMKTWCAEVIQDMQTDITSETRKMKQYKKLRDIPVCSKCFLMKTPGWCQCLDDSPLQVQGFRETLDSAVLEFGNSIYHYATRRAFPSFVLSFHWYGGRVFFACMVNCAAYYIQLSTWYGLPIKVTLVALAWTLSVFITSKLPIWLIFILTNVALYSLISSITYYAKLTNQIVRERSIAVISGRAAHSVLFYASTATLGIGCFRAVRTLFKHASMDTQGNLNPANMGEVEDRLREKSDWVATTKLPLISSVKCVTTTPNQLQSKIRRNLFHYSVPGVARSFGLFVSTRVFLINNHMYEKIRSYQHIVLEKENVQPYSAETQQAKRIYYADGSPSDYCVIILRNAPAMCSLVEYFNDTECCGKGHLMLTDHVTLESNNVHVYSEKMHTDVIPEITHWCYAYDTPQGTKKGDCGSPLVSTMNGSVICGLHCVGSRTRTAGGAYPLFRQDLKKAIVACNDLVIQGECGVPACIGDRVNLDPYGQGELDFSEELDERHFMHYYPEAYMAGINVVGYCTQARVRGFSEVTHSPAYPHCEELGVEITHCKPLMRADRDANAYMEVHVKHMDPVETQLITRARQMVFSHLSGKIKQLKFKARPLSIDQALNGIEGNRFISPLDETKSAGFGCKGKKSELLYVDYDPVSGKKTLTPRPEFLHEIHTSLEKLKGYEKINNVFKACQKDEPVKLDPQTGKPKKFTRLFMADTFCQTVLMKMYFGPLQTFLLSLPLASTNGAGINAIRDEWTQVFEYLTDSGKQKDRIMCGDYSKWDQRLDGQTIRESGILLCHLARELGYSTEECTIMVSLLEGVIERYVLIAGALIHTQHGMPSGAFITLLMNGVSNMMLHVCAFLDSNPDKNFFQYVRLLTVGDDSVAGVGEGVNFNQKIMSEFCHRHGMVYTDDNKGVITQEFTNIFEIRFCQRAFVWNEILQHHTAALALSSIWKSIYMCRSSKLDGLAVFIQNSEAAILELARHEEEVYEQNIQILRTIASRLQISHCIKRLDFSWRNMQKVMQERYFPLVLLINQDSPPADEPFLQRGGEEDLVTEGCTLAYEHALGFSSIAIIRPRKGVIPPDRRTKKWISFQYSTKNDEQIGVMSLKDHQQQWVSGSNGVSDPTTTHANTSDTNDGFFSRPVLIGNYQWTPGISFSREINPWDVFFSDPKIGNRLAHFKNLRATLHVQFILNGSPFNHGRLIADYTPLHQTDQVAAVDPGLSADFIEASQRPHIYMDPCLSQGGELVLPFCFPKTYVDIPKKEWQQLGVINIRDFNTLAHANGGTEPLTLTVFAYASEVSLNTPTSAVQDDLEPQGGDEYGKISFPAHLVAQAAGKLKDIPMIAPYARSTEMIAKGVGALASLFGFSRPRMVPEETSLVRHFGEGAVTNFPDTSLSLAVDAKKEVTIDPRVVGVEPADEMTILSLATRESYIDTFTWSGDDSSNQHLYSVPISPILGQVVGDDYHITPMTFASLPFDYWKGTIEIRLQVVCSQYHKGRIRIVWDPEAVTQAESYNVNYATVLDITESTEMTFKIGWGQNVDYENIAPLSILEQMPRTNWLQEKLFGSNGTLSVFAFNNLTSPSDQVPRIDVNVFARACDDFEVNAPRCGEFSRTRVKTITDREDGNPTRLYGGSPYGHIVTEPAQLIEYDFASNPTEPIAKFGDPDDGFITVWSYNTIATPDVLVSFTISALNPGSYSITPPVGDRQDVTISNGETVTTTFQWPAQAFNVNVGYGFLFALNGISFADLTLESIVTIKLQGNTQVYDANFLSARIPDSEAVEQAGVDIWRPSSGFENEQFELTLPSDTYIPGHVIVYTLDRFTLNGVDYGTNFVNTDKVRSYTAPIPGNRKLVFEQTSSSNPLRIASIAFDRSQDLETQGAEDRLADEENANAPEGEPMNVESMGPPSDIRGLNDIYFGERVTSMRQMLKRTTSAYRVKQSEGPIWQISMPQYPTIGDADPIVASAENFIDYVSSAYVAMRGSTRIKVHTFSIGGTGPPSDILCTRIPNSEAPEMEIIPDSGSNLYFQFCGTAIDSLMNKPYGEFEIPYYSNLRFHHARYRRTRNEANFVERDFCRIAVSEEKSTSLFISYSTGEDFSLSYFLCTPILQIEDP